MSRHFRTLVRLTITAIVLLGLAACGDDSTTTAEPQPVTEAAGKFETFQGADGQWYFHLVAANGEKVLQSEGYTSKQGCNNGIESVKTNGVDLNQYKLLEAVDGDWYFNLIAKNYQVIATSETYASKANAERGIDTVQWLITQYLHVEAAETGGAHFDLFVGSDNQYYFHLQAANGEILLQSEGYVAKSGAMNGIDSVSENGREIEQYEIREAHNEQHYFVLKAKNYQIIARGEMYSSLYACEQGIQTIIDLLASEKVAYPE